MPKCRECTYLSVEPGDSGFCAVVRMRLEREHNSCYMFAPVSASGPESSKTTSHGDRTEEAGQRAARVECGCCAFWGRVPDIDGKLPDSGRCSMFEKIRPSAHEACASFMDKCEDQTPKQGPSGVKHDQSKPRMGLVPGLALIELAKVMTYGAGKYGDHNWLGGLAHRRLYDALMRHSTAWLNGEDTDQESGLPHLAHACACAMMLLEMTLRRPDLDDRYKGGE